ncbi:11990_t:CDS:2 [Entrophospora sp. SA101]|nr:11990_t:CDS:2 [Entrophospora sp. SA101]
MNQGQNVVYVSDTDSNCTGEYNADTSDTLSDNSDTTIILSTTTRRTDIISNFPLELCWHIMGYLDLFNICQAAQENNFKCVCEEKVDKEEDNAKDIHEEFVVVNDDDNNKL